MKKFIILFSLQCLLALCLSSCFNKTRFNYLSYKNEDVQVYTKGNLLFVGNSQIERVWKLTPYGLVTKIVKNNISGKIWQHEKSTNVCDWSYDGLITGKERAKLLSLRVGEHNDEGFTDEHTELVAEFEYPEKKLFLKYTIWIYPQTQGIRTQIYLKGDVDNEIVEQVQQQINATTPSLRLVSGTNTNSYEAASYAPLWHASFAHHQSSIEYQAVNLNQSRKYKLGISWWSFDNEEREQRVRLTSVDSEISCVVVGKTVVPSFRKSRASAKEYLVDVPDEVLADGSFRIYIDNLNGAKNAIINEIWLYEEGNHGYKIDFGEDARIKKLNKDAPDAFQLAAYFDCGEKNPDDVFIVHGNVDYLPVDATALKRYYIGYFNDTQHRNTPSTPIMREELREECNEGQEVNWWANIIAVEQANDGVMMIKESHKCVNQYGVETGNFIVNSQGVFNTGTSISPSEIVPDKYKWFWGSWMIPYQGGEVERQFVLKKFDRKRYPVNIDRDMYSLVCTWGHSRNPRDGRNYATEREVLKELDFIKEINVDMLLIDDGWQVSLSAKNWKPDEGRGWYPAPSIYPNGWKAVKEKADKLKIKLGLWGVAQDMPAQHMIWNWQQIKMNQLKLDFANFRSHDMLSDMMDTVRLFLKSVNHQSSVSWDLTENRARYGYYWAREYGNLHFMNRKPFYPLNVMYVPHLALRDFWLLAKYNNLNKYQLVIQHAKATEHVSDAYQHPENYCVATALMGIPEFMALPRFYQPEDRKRVGDLMKIYKNVQQDIFTGYVFPVGNQPDNASWTGFQSINFNNEKTGYLTIFRELHNRDMSKQIALNFLKEGDRVEIENLMTKTKEIQTAGANSRITFKIQSPADFLFLKWTLL